MAEVSSSAEIAAAPDKVIAIVTDPAKFAEFQVGHQGFVGDAPASFEQGTKFGQKLSIMGMPAQVSWTVDSASDNGVALSGTGPMGVTVKLGIDVAPAGDGSKVDIKTSFEGQALAAFAAAIERETQKNQEASLEKIKALAEG